MTREDVLNLVQRFASGALEDSCLDENFSLGEDLFHNIEHVNDIIPMLHSPYQMAQWQACYIVSETADDVTTVFPYVVPLLHSSSNIIRRTACECYRCFASTGEQIAEVIKCLEDRDRSVRCVSSYAITECAIELIKDAVDVLRTSDNSKFADPVERFILNPQPPHEIDPKTMRKKTRFEKYCYYIMLLRGGLSHKTVKPFVKAMREPDLVFFHR